MGSEPKGIRCPKCGSTSVHVRHTRPLPGGRKRRYRTCADCGQHFATIEVPPSQAKFHR
jgi:transcriptional regulator NrdR family protein